MVNLPLEPEMKCWKKKCVWSMAEVRNYTIEAHDSIIGILILSSELMGYAMIEITNSLWICSVWQRLIFTTIYHQ